VNLDVDGGRPIRRSGRFALRDASAGRRPVIAISRFMLLSEFGGTTRFVPVGREGT